MRMTGWLGWRKAVVAGLLLLVGLLQACTSNDSTKGPTFPSTIAGSGQPFTVILTSSAGSVKCGSSLTITALVLSSTGLPVAAVTVTFKTSEGSISPTSAQTDGNGEAKTTLSATSSTVSGCRDGTDDSVTVTASTLPAAAGVAIATTITIIVFP